MPFQYTWELDLGGEGTSLPTLYEYTDVNYLAPHSLLDLSPHYYIPTIDVNVVSGTTGYYDYTLSGVQTPVGVSVYFPNNTEVTWALGITASATITNLEIYNDNYGTLFKGSHGGTGLEFFEFDALKTSYQDIWVIYGDPLPDPHVVFRSANKYQITVSGKNNGQIFIPTVASGNPLTDLPCMSNVLPSDWSVYHPVELDFHRAPTVSGSEGSLSITLTLAPHYSAVYGGCVTCTGSHTVDWIWEETFDNVSGTLSLMSYTNDTKYFALQTKTIGDAIGINPNNIRRGLLAWHPFEEEGLIYEDHSHNNVRASGIGDIIQTTGKHGFAVGLDSFPYGHIETDIGQQSQDYMVSFWFKPTMLLTSGVEHDFVVMEADDFYGDHFGDAWDYLDYPRFKGWELINTTPTCSAGYNSSYLRIQGSTDSDWFGPQGDASVLYIPIEKSKDWSVETKFVVVGNVSAGQKAGFIFFDTSYYYDYCSLVLQGDTPEEAEYQYVESSFPDMTSQTTPSPYRIDCDDYYQNNFNYHAWRAFENDWGTYYYRSNEGLPCWVRIDLGEDTSQVIQGYRIRRRDTHFPRDWQFQASNSTGGPWTTLHTMVNQPDLSDGQWTGWFYFSNETIYRYYRFYITESRGDEYATWDGTEFYIKDRVRINEDANIKVQTHDLSYTIEDHASVSGTWLFEMHKRGDYVWFGYREDEEDSLGFFTPIYRMDVSLWGDSMGLGVMSANPLGTAPEVIYDYVRFKRGRMPAGVGDPEIPGRLKIAYNHVDVGDTVEERTDSRLWLMTNRDGHAYGTAQYKWNPDQWYLIQFGIKPGALPVNMNQDYCWWVNTRQEKGLLVESGTGASVFVPSGINLSYFDPTVCNTYKGAFELDEVSHWNRWLTGEEILKMWNRVSQMSWHATEPFREFSSNLLTSDITISGDRSLMHVDPDVLFEWYTQYQAPASIAKDVQFEKISYRIQKDLPVVAWQIEPQVINIFRRSSGWIAADPGCYCMEEPVEGEIVSASANKVYSNEVPMDLLDGSESTLYRSGSAPPVYIMFSYDVLSNYWKALRFKSFNNGTYWDNDFPKDIKVYGSDKSSPSLTNNDDWEYQFQIRMSLPSGPLQWSPWAEFPRSILFRHYRLYILNNTYDTGNWISLAEMQIDTDPLTVPTIYSRMDVRGGVSVYTRAFDYPTTDFIQVAREKKIENQEPFMVVTTTGVGEDFAIPHYDLTSPRVSHLTPSRNQRFVHPELLWQDPHALWWRVSEFGGSPILENYNRVWMSMPSGHDYQLQDSFCFYGFDFLDPTLSGSIIEGPYGWKAVNTSGTGLRTLLINDGYNVTVSGEKFNTVTDSIEDAQNILKYTTYADPSVTSHVGGTGYFEVNNQGEFRWDVEEKTAPYVYWEIPSGINQWDTIVKLDTDFGGSKRGQYVGLMLDYPNDPERFYQLMVTSSGVCVMTSGTMKDPPVVYVDREDSDPIWLKISNQDLHYSFYCSVNEEDWIEIPTISGQIISNTPLMSGYSSPSPYQVFESSHDGSEYAWKLFNRVYETPPETGEPPDGSTENLWRSQHDCPQWVTLDYGEEVFITHYRWFTANRGLELLGNECPYEVELYGSGDNADWTLLDSRTVAYPGRGVWTSLQAVSRPGLYRYYCFQVGSVYTRDSHVSSSSIVMLAELEYWGPRRVTASGDGGDPRLGVIAVSDKRRPPVWAESDLLFPGGTFSSNTNGDYVITSNDNNADVAWKLFNVGSYGQAIQLNAGKWVAIELPEPKVLTHWRLYSEGYSSSGGYYWGLKVEGSNDYLHWDLLYDTNAWACTTKGATVFAHPGPSLDCWEIDNKKSYKWYRIRAHENNSSYWGINYVPLKGLYLIGHGEDLFTEVTDPSDVIARFHEVTFISNTPLPDYMKSLGDPWQLVLKGDEVLSSTNMNGVFSYDKQDDYTVYLYEFLKSGRSFTNGEQVYLRFQFKDSPSFRVDYTGYESDPSVYLYLKGDGLDDERVDTSLGQVDNSIYNHTLNTNNASTHTEYTSFDSGVKYIGQGSMRFDGSSYLVTDSSIEDASLNSDWTVHGWVYSLDSIQSSPLGYFDFLRVVDEADALQLALRLYNNRIDIVTTSGVSGVTPLASSFAVDSWVHLAVVRSDNWFHTFIDGVRQEPSSYVVNNISSGDSLEFKIIGLDGYLDHYVVEHRAKWLTSFVTSNKLDEICTFKITDWKDLEVGITPEPDTQSPVCVPVSPLPGASGVCPASGIKFDVLDDYSGVNWGELIIQIDNITVWSGGNNMTDWYDDRGTLVYEERGRKDGEWEYDFPQGASGTTVITDGINRQLYPPGTVYSGSGAWGRRFTYFVDDDTQIGFFDYHMVITLSGSDNRGYLSQYDAIDTNRFSYEYEFDFITNSNIQFSNFFMNVGESERIDIMQAKGKHIWVDLWDSDYPVTDIDEDESYLNFTDGVLDFVCSGTWFTTYTGSSGPASGIRIHRLHYDAGDYYWDGHRTMHWTVHAQNNNPLCGVYNRDEYELCYGWHIFWHHDSRIPPFEFDSKLPVFVSIKTQDYVPSRYSRSYPIWTAPAGTSDFNVGIKALPLGSGNQVEVNLIAHSHYLQYSEDVEVELTCKDRDGNELLYLWTFTTEDEPAN